MLVRAQYERLIYTLPTCYPSIRLSTLVLVPPGLDTARLTGLVALGDDCVLCVYEFTPSYPRMSTYSISTSPPNAPPPT
jgi:hypothetical protein